MAKLGKGLLLVVGVVLIGAGVTLAVYSSILFQQNVQSLEKMQQILQK